MAVARAALTCGRKLFTAQAPLLAPTRAYHEIVHDHFNNPRNVGVLDKANKNVGTALVGAGGDHGDVVIKLQVEVEDGVIKDAKFETLGCDSAIAASSLATEMIIGKNINEATQLTNKDFSSYLKLPPVKIHCSELAEEAIKTAIDDYKEKQATA